MRTYHDRCTRTREMPALRRSLWSDVADFGGLVLAVAVTAVWTWAVAWVVVREATEIAGWMR